MKIKDIRVIGVRLPGKPAPRGTGRNSAMPLDILGAGDLHLVPRGDVAHQYVEVETEDGLIGYGIVGAFDGAAEYTILNHLRPLLLGMNVLDSRRAWELMFRATVGYGRRGIVISAISAVDLALWDLKGKILGQPVYNLLGGRMRDAIPVYASRLYASDDISHVRDEAQRYVDEGFTAMKLRPAFGPADGWEGLQKNIRQIETVRDVIGPSSQLMVDVYSGWDLPYTMRMLPVLSDYNVYWLEEPVLPDDIEGYAEIRKLAHSYGVLIAGGEHEATRWGVKQLLDSRAVDILQVDVNRVGGITEALGVWAMAAAHGVDVIPHAGQVHNFHMVISHLNSPIAEYFPEPLGNPDRNEVFKAFWKGEPAAEDGYVNLSEEPGLGITPDAEMVARFQVS